MYEGHLMVRLLVNLFLAVVISISFVEVADAAKKKRKKLTESSVTFTATLDSGKTVDCLQNKKGIYIPGKINKKGTFFTPASVPYKKKLKRLKEKVADAGSDKKKKKKAKKKLKKHKQKFKEQKAKCKAGPGGTGPGPTDPAFCESMDPYDGAFGASDAAYLLEKFGFGVGEKEQPLVDNAASTGLAAFVDDLVAAVSEDQGVLETVDAIADQDPVNDANDAILLHYILTNNPVHMRVTESLHGVITTARDVLAGNQQKLWYAHWKLLRDAAHNNKTYIETVQESAIHPMMLLFLDNGSSIAANPNENFARELQELFTLGPICPDGTVNYSESRPLGDVLNAARVLTGWKVEQIGEDWTAKFVNGQHEQTPQTMYAGTPHQFSTSNFADLINNILTKHPCAGDFYARELLKDFLTEEPPVNLIRKFGAVIRANGFKIMDSVATLMKSKAAFCGTYYNSTTKKTDRLLAELVRVMKLRNAIDLDPDGNLEDLTQGVESSGYQVDLPPDGVFYIPTLNFRTPAAQLELINSLGRLIDIAEAADPQIFVPQNILPQGDVPSIDVVRYVAKRLNITLSTEQEAALDFYMNRTFTEEGTTINFYDNTNPDDRREKGLTLYMIMSILPQASLG